MIDDKWYILNGHQGCIMNGYQWYIKNDDQIIGRYGPNEMGPVAFCRISDLGLALAQTTLTPRRFRRINILQ